MSSAPTEAKRARYDVVIASPSPAIDSYYVMDAVRPGNVNRARYAFHTAGGKGNNMARAVRLLGGTALSLGIVGGLSGQFITEELAREGIDADMVWSEYETRRCSTVLTPDRHETTVRVPHHEPIALFRDIEYADAPARRFGDRRRRMVDCTRRG